MKITRSSETLAGLTIVAEQDAYTLTLYRVGNCFSDSISEIIIDLPIYNIDDVSDGAVEEMFTVARQQYEEMKRILGSDDM
jgi:hypothetical protein